ncbi:MAG TPA: cysteine dioxygenase family protein [Streptosporangiaceae bacterium]|jgi:predicted metal-dependent enzyme (double-stranded beta helix superfamily)|nr:cysteine dioxygenase family protein [Streptosporangiaceae bacterium]
MSLTSTDKAAPSSKAARAVPAGTCPDGLVRAVRAEVRCGLDWQQTAERVVGVLRDRLPDPAVLLPPLLRRGDPAGYQSHLLHAEPDGSFSVSVMVWLPGQQTVIHDHVAWCVTGVLQGREYEEVFALTDGGRALELAARNLNLAGTVSGFAPPGDIHRVRNTGDDVAISMHIYGADISRLGNSIRREYTLPILP